MQEATLLCLLSALNDMGERGSNPVLDVMGESLAPQQGQHYPETPITYMNPQGEPLFRAYYHTHLAPFQFEGEHGHFHLFANIATDGPPQWSHLAALSMDHQGQPRHWFSVNRWVSDGPWLQRESLKTLSWPDPLRGESALSQWLWAMLVLYQQELQVLLDTRDKHLLSQIIDTSTEETMLENRAFYLLSEKAVNVMQKLQTVLTNG